MALAGSAAAGDAGGRTRRDPAGRTPGSAPDQPQTLRGRQHHARRQHPDRDAGRDCPRPSPFRGGAAPDHRGKGRLHGRQRRARADVPGRSRPDPQLVMARPRQRHRCADDVARRPRHPAGADARGRVLRRIPPGAARHWCGGQRLAMALPDVGDAGRLAAAGRRRYRRRPARGSSSNTRTGSPADR